MTSNGQHLRRWGAFSLGLMLLTGGCALSPQVAAVCPKPPKYQPADLGEDFQDQFDSILYNKPKSPSSPPAPITYELNSGSAKLTSKP